MNPLSCNPLHLMVNQQQCFQESETNPLTPKYFVSGLRIKKFELLQFDGIHQNISIFCK